jgi:hypothetical protein
MEPYSIRPQLEKVGGILIAILILIIPILILL